MLIRDNCFLGEEKESTSIHALLEEMDLRNWGLFPGFCGETVALVDILGYIQWIDLCVISQHVTLRESHGT